MRPPDHRQARLDAAAEMTALITAASPSPEPRPAKPLRRAWHGGCDATDAERATWPSRYRAGESVGHIAASYPDRLINHNDVRQELSRQGVRMRTYSEAQRVRYGAAVVDGEVEPAKAERAAAAVATASTASTHAGPEALSGAAVPANGAGQKGTGASKAFGWAGGHQRHGEARDNTLAQRKARRAHRWRADAARGAP